MIYALIIFALTIIIKLAVDVHLYQSRKKNKHTIGPALVAVALIACSWLGGWITIPMWGFAYWALFDPLYAVFIGQHWTFLGTSAKLDRLQHKYPIVVKIKYFGAIISIITVCVTKFL